MAGLDFLHNNFALEQNTRLSRLFSGANDDQYASFDRFFGQVSNDPFAQVQGLEFDTARFRTENSFEAIQQDFVTIHNDILNIETDHAPVMIAYDAPSVFMEQILDSYETPVSYRSDALPDFAPSNVADHFSFFDAASGEVLSFRDDSFGEIVGALQDVIALEADIFDIPVLVEDMAQEHLQTITDYADTVTTIGAPVDAPQEITVIDHFSDTAWQTSSMVIEMAHDPYEQSYTQSLLENVLNDMQIGAWDDMVLFDPEHLNYAVAANDPTNNVFTQDLALNDEGYSSQLSDLQNLTSY